MKIAVYTLTRDRLEFTQHCFQTLWANAGAPFDHFVLDNGSQDGTPQWLKENENKFRAVECAPVNLGISKGSNMMLDKIFEAGAYELIIKLDNDCEVKSPYILKRIEWVVGMFRTRERVIVLSPRVEGIVRQPARLSVLMYPGGKIGLTAIIGGLFHIVPAEIYRRYRYPEELPLAWGQDDHFCDWLHRQGVDTGYIEDLVVAHYLTTDGQAKKYPEYFKRKRQEEKPSGADQGGKPK